MAEVAEVLLTRIGELEQQLRALEQKVQELQVELRGYWWGVSNADSERREEHTDG
jgi:chaperonin cofactor prefoldin